MSRLVRALCAVLCAVPSLALADLVAAKCQAPTSGPVSPIAHRGLCVGYVRANPDGGFTTVTFGSPMSGVMLASPDGRTVVMLASYLEANVKAGRVYGFRSGPVSEGAGPGEENPVVVRVFRDGRQLASQRIHDLLGEKLRPNYDEHLRWLELEPTELPASGPLALQLSSRVSTGATLLLDLSTGALAPRGP